MPSSQAITIPVVIDVIKRLKPTAILDVGVGFGKWGHLFREYTDIKASEHDPARYNRGNWTVRIDGIDAYPAYVTDMHHYLYNAIHIGPVESVLPTLGEYDVVFFGDVIEHMDKSSGMRVLATALEHASKAVILTTPKYDSGQEELCGNPFERHRSLWTAAEFLGFSGARVATVYGSQLVAVIPAKGTKAPRVRVRRKGPWRRLWKRFRRKERIG